MMTELERLFLQAKRDGTIAPDTSWADFKTCRDDDGYFVRPDGVRFATPDNVFLPPPIPERFRKQATMSAELAELLDRLRDLAATYRRNDQELSSETDAWQIAADDLSALVREFDTRAPLESQP